MSYNHRQGFPCNELCKELGSRESQIPLLCSAVVCRRRRQSMPGGKPVWKTKNFEGNVSKEIKLFLSIKPQVKSFQVHAKGGSEGFCDFVVKQSPYGKIFRKFV